MDSPTDHTRGSRADEAQDGKPAGKVAVHRMGAGAALESASAAASAARASPAASCTSASAAATASLAARPASSLGSAHHRNDQIKSLERELAAVVHVFGVRV